MVERMISKLAPDGRILDVVSRGIEVSGRPNADFERLERHIGAPLSSSLGTCHLPFAAV
jgi:hypothetical protein